MAALLLRLGPGDKVIVPSFTFVSTAIAFARQGAEIVFADVEPDTLALDPESVKRLMDDDVKAVVTVHYAGIAGPIHELMAVVPPHVALVEDNAHGLFGAIDGRRLGTFGKFSTLSFHETKNFVCGEGGALILNDRSDVERAHVLYDKGTNRRQFFLGQVDKYTWQDIGSSFGLSDVLAAYLLGQLEQKDGILAKRKAVFDRYLSELGELETGGVRLPTVPDGCQPAYHLFYMLCRSEVDRNELLEFLKTRNIQATFHYVPLHNAPAASRFTSKEYACPVTDDVASRLIRLPFHNALSEQDLDRVTSAVRDFYR